MFYAIGTEVLGQTQHVIYTIQVIKIFDIFHFLLVLNISTYSITKHKSKIIKNKVNKQIPIKENMLELKQRHKKIAYVMMHETMTLIHWKY